METLSAETRAMLELYKKERPDIFARLPLPKKLAEDYGVPISSETVHLMTYMKSHMAIVNGTSIDEFEEKIGGYVTDASGNIKEGKTPTPDDKFTTFLEGLNQAQIRDKARKAYFKQENDRIIKELQSENLENQIEMKLASLQSEPTFRITEGSTNAAFVPQ